MKVLFVGEGNNDVGASPSSPTDLRPACGPVCILARKVSPAIAEDSVALTWSAISRFNPKARKRGYQAKVAGAILIATRNGCAGSVFVADRDGEEDRLAALEEGVNQAGEKNAGHAIAFGLAIESVEAWALGVPEAIAEILGVEEEQVRAHYPGIHVESLYQKSGKEDHRPKDLLKKIVGLKHQEDTTEFRQDVADKTEITALERACPQGFAPFAAKLREVFGQKQ